MKKVKRAKECAVFDQFFYTGHNVDDFETLVKEPDKFRLLISESLLILLDDLPLNRYVTSIPLELFS